jgi:uncharacterized protein (DUF2384 family)
LTPQPLFTDVNLSQSTVQPQLTGQDNEIDMLESLSEVLYGATEAQQKYANKISNYCFERTGKRIHPDFSSVTSCRLWIDKMLSKGYKPPYDK